jgi:hypothetical protein
MILDVSFVSHFQNYCGEVFGDRKFENTSFAAEP